MVSITFHGIADVFRATETKGTNRQLQNRAAMFEQVVLAIAALLAAPARDALSPASIRALAYTK